MTFMCILISVPHQAQLKSWIEFHKLEKLRD